MFIAALTLTIHPGGTPDTKAWLKAAHRHLPATLQDRSLTLNVEVGHVNTLLTLFALNDPTHDVCALRDGLAAAGAAHPNPHPVTPTLELMQADDGAWSVLDRIKTDHAPVLLQVTRQKPVAADTTPSVILSPVTGTLNTHWQLTRLVNTDQALLLAEATLQNDAYGLLRSCLLDPVR